MRILNMLCALCLLLMSGACGRVENQAICHSFLEETACGGKTAFGSGLCASYGKSRCDMQRYFDCLREYFVCIDGMYDAERAKLAETACYQQSRCQMGQL
jgi:hypothetical protein